jgi:hypothetical protein
MAISSHSILTFNDDHSADGSIKRREGTRRVWGKPQSAMEMVEDEAELYVYSTRRMQDKIAQGEILGIEKIGSKYVRYGEPGELIGPIPDIPRKIALLPGTRGISYEVFPGSRISSAFKFSSFALQTRDGEDRVHPSITIQTMVGFSGVIMKLTCFS